MTRGTKVGKTNNPTSKQYIKRLLNGLDLTALHSTDAGFYTVDLKSPRAMGTTSFSYF